MQRIAEGTVIRFDNTHAGLDEKDTYTIVSHLPNSDVYQLQGHTGTTIVVSAEFLYNYGKILATSEDDFVGDFWAPSPWPTECRHEWKIYEGLTESYYYCTKCDEKRGL